MRIIPLALAASSLVFASAAAAAKADSAFLDFPHVDSISAAKVPAFAWLTRQADNSTVMFAKAPDFRRVMLAARADDGGQPITDLLLAPDGKHVVFTTGQPRGDASFNPASLVDPPVVTLWLEPTVAGAKPVKLGPGSHPFFSPDGRTLLFKRDGDLVSVGTAAPAAKPKLFAKGGGSWSQFTWTRNGDLVFIDNRRGYSFLGRYRSGASAVDWLVTGVDRLALPVISPDGGRVAFLRLPGRKHSTTPDQTEAAPFSIGLLGLGNGAVQTLWSTRGPAITLGMDDDEGALRWASDSELVFYSEDDGWGRLYALAAAGGAPRPLTPANCTVAESEAARAQLLVIDNCVDLDTRQMTLVDAGTGAMRAVPQPDPVLAHAAIGGGYAAFVGASANQAPLIRIMDLASGQTRLAEHYADYGYTSPLTGAPPRDVHLTSLDGLPFTGQLFSPAGPGPHPGLIYVHGGPQRQMFPAFHYMGYYSNDYAVNRRLAEQGYTCSRSITVRASVTAARSATRRGAAGATPRNIATCSPPAAGSLRGRASIQRRSASGAALMAAC